MARRPGSRQAGGMLALGVIVAALAICGQLTGRPPASSQPPPARALPTLAISNTEPTDVRAGSGATTSVRSEVVKALLPTTAPSATSEPTRRPTATETVSILPPALQTRLTEPQTVAAKDANLRGGPGTNYPVVGSVKAGAALAVVERNAKGDWYRLASGGWIAAFLVRAAPALLPVAQSIPPTPRPQAPATPRPVRVVTIPTSTPVTRFDPPTAAPARSCCKVCTGSKACGNSCISRNKQCHQPPGCACQG